MTPKVVEDVPPGATVTGAAQELRIDSTSGPRQNWAGHCYAPLYRVRPPSSTATPPGYTHQDGCPLWPKEGNTGVMPPNTGQARRRPSTSPFRDSPAPTYETFEVDSRVIHDRYGLGRVVQLNTDRMNVKFGDSVIDIDTRSPKVHLL